MAKPHWKGSLCIKPPELVSVAIKRSSRLGPQVIWLITDDLTDEPVIFDVSI
jgi:hypothetical protein